jgi:hypothetical protein
MNPNIVHGFVPDTLCVSYYTKIAKTNFISILDIAFLKFGRSFWYLLFLLHWIKSSISITLTNLDDAGACDVVEGKQLVNVDLVVFVVRLKLVQMLTISFWDLNPCHDIYLSER